MKMNIFASLVAIGTLAALVNGCAADSGSAEGDEDSEEANTTQDELKSYATKVAGEYKLASAPRYPRFVNLSLKEGVFHADVDTGLRCFRAPCPSSVHVMGKYTATKTYLRLTPFSTDPQTEYHGRYKYKLADDRLDLSRAGARWSGWSETLEREVPASVWTPESTQFVARNLGGGFVAPPPPGSTCGRGATYTVEAASRNITWERCEMNGAKNILETVSGTKKLTAKEYASVIASMTEVTISSRDTCGADKPMKKLIVSNPSGDTTYTDDFYSCTGTGPFVTNIDPLFITLRGLTGSISE